MKYQHTILAWREKLYVHMYPIYPIVNTQDLQNSEIPFDYIFSLLNCQNLKANLYSDTTTRDDETSILDVFGYQLVNRPLPIMLFFLIEF